MNLKQKQLPDDTESLKQIIFSLQQKNDYLQEMVRLFQNEIFGRKSEVRPEIDVNQLQLFTPPEEPEPIEPDETIEIKGYARKKRGRKPLPADLPRIEVILDIPEEDKQCACGVQLDRIGEDVSEKLDYIPAKIRVIRYIRPKYACKQCEGVEDDAPTVKIAPAAVQLIPKSIATEGLLAHIAVSKFADGLPLYRQQKIFNRLDVELSRTTMANWMIQVAGCCQPVIELLQHEIRSGPLINVDESPFQVHKEPGRSDTCKSYMWVFCGGPLSSPVKFYRYHPTRSAKVVQDMLEDYLGYVQSDGYKAYDYLSRDPNITPMGCLAHARRKFIKVNNGRKKSRGKKKTSKGLADEALDYIGELYRIEKYARNNELSLEQIQALRQEKAKPILDKFKIWLDTHHPLVPPESLIGKAIQYTLNQWDRLIVYVDEGFLKPDNNTAENAIRPFVIGRKNWLFSGAPKGAEASAVFFTLIETAKANGLEPYAYLRYLFENLPLAQTESDYLKLLPNRLDIASINKHAATQP
jgi:transposase